VKNNTSISLGKIISYLFIFSLVLIASISLYAKNNVEQIFASPIEGRWDLKLEGKETYPSWLEVTHSGNNMLVGQFVAIVGSARPISKVNYDNGKVSFSIPAQWESGENDLSFEGTLEGESLTGTISFPDGTKYNFTGVRAPLFRKRTITWGTPLRLFSGKDLGGWHATGQNQWKAVDGILSSPKSGANLITNAKFTDFKLHVEFKYPKGSNSGIYLRGRYEVQITDSKGLEPSKVDFGAIYGFITPNEMVAKAPDEWQTYDITLVGRLITIVANGKTIVCNQQIPGITGGALDSDEGKPGPLMIQGDHGPVEFRNIILTPAK